MNVNWDDDIPNINGKIKLMATKPPTSYQPLSPSLSSSRQLLQPKDHRSPPRPAQESFPSDEGDMLRPVGNTKMCGVQPIKMREFKSLLEITMGFWWGFCFFGGALQMSWSWNTCWLRTGIPEWMMIIPNILNSPIPHHHERTGVSWRHCLIGIPSIELMNRPLKS